MKLVTFMAKACHYAQQHIDDAQAWPTDEVEREDYLQCVSYQMACFFSQNTKHGWEGVDWDVVMPELATHPMKSVNHWKKILNQIADELGGWKKEKNS